MTFADKLKRWRGVERCGFTFRGKISQVEAARLLRVNVRTYQDWEIGRHEPVGALRFLLEQRMLETKTAGRPVASSNRKAKGAPSGNGTGSKRKSSHAKKKDKA